MTIINGHAGANGADKPRLPLTGRASVQYSDEEIRQLVAALEVPFDPRIIEWRVANTSDYGGNLRGQLVAYADSRAYQDRLNALFTPAGWTRKYERQFSGEVLRGRNEKKAVAKVFVTCELTIHGLGSNSSTGEAWADDDQAGTKAEAQAFKRAASCFGDTTSINWPECAAYAGKWQWTIYGCKLLVEYFPAPAILERLECLQGVRRWGQLIANSLQDVELNLSQQGLAASRRQNGLSKSNRKIA